MYFLICVNHLCMAKKITILCCLLAIYYCLLYSVVNFGKIYKYSGYFILNCKLEVEYNN